MTPETELRIRANTRRKSVFARLGVLIAAKRVTLPDTKAWVDELAGLDLSQFPKPERDAHWADPLFTRMDWR